MASVLVACAIDPTALRFPHANPATRKMSPTDLGDWEAIEAWADILPEAFGLVDARA